MKSWRDLKWAHKKIRLGKQSEAKKPQGQPMLSWTPAPTAGQVIIQANYLAGE